MRSKIQYRASWLLIYYHNIETGTLFNDTTALSIDNEYQYSIIGTFAHDERLKHKEYFEYLLEYPDLHGYNRWKQKIDIASTTINQTSTDIGFKPVHIDFPNSDFGSISKSNSGETIFDGSPAIGGNSLEYWFSIGPTSYYHNEYQFPGPMYI